MQVYTSSAKNSRRATKGHLPVAVCAILKADQDFPWVSVDIGLPLAQLCGNSVVGAVDDAAILVPVALPVPAVLAALAECRNASNIGRLAFDPWYRHVEAVVRAGASHSSFPPTHVPRPAFGDGDLAFLNDGLCERTGGGGGESEEGCE